MERPDSSGTKQISYFSFYLKDPIHLPEVTITTTTRKVECLERGCFPIPEFRALPEAPADWVSPSRLYSEGPLTAGGLYTGTAHDIQHFPGTLRTRDGSWDWKTLEARRDLRELAHVCSR